jgi:hypothetical protein
VGDWAAAIGVAERACGALATERNARVTSANEWRLKLAAQRAEVDAKLVALGLGGGKYARRVAKREALLRELRALKGRRALAGAAYGVGGTEALCAAATRARRGVLLRLLADEMERPLNGHRWRELSEKEPARWALLQRVQRGTRLLLEWCAKRRELDTAVEEERAAQERPQALAAQKASTHAAEALAALLVELKVKAAAQREVVGQLVAAAVRAGSGALSCAARRMQWRRWFATL